VGAEVVILPRCGYLPFVALPEADVAKRVRCATPAWIRRQPYCLDDRTTICLPVGVGALGSGSTAPSSEPCQAQQTS